MDMSPYPNGTEMGPKDTLEELSELFGGGAIVVGVLFILASVIRLAGVFEHYLVALIVENFLPVLVLIIALYFIGYGCAKMSETYGY
ncbi:hypothetical protein GRX01_00285 [Halobaculum sp. WSA2]|uniref:Uncharacterized protein n=1 Tax=Halobaculum saliterrae TaxID=2073113 RepID=A0A6B0SZF8_9EURY|nr:hypothetical protein [Halobaculum saliterrae]MXR39799.1 hypothetical protein [Halobaculum saliterrae]